MIQEKLLNDPYQGVQGEILGSSERSKIEIHSQSSKTYAAKPQNIQSKLRICSLRSHGHTDTTFRQHSYFVDGPLVEVFHFLHFRP